MPPRPLRELLQDGAWAGRRCFVVGGGPSLRGFDWRRLDGELVIAVNRAAEFCSPALACWRDKPFIRWAGGRLTSPHVYFHLEPEPIPAQADYVVRIASASHWAAAWGRSLEEGVGYGGNTGYAALNLADVLGASPIYLLGFDLQGAGERQAWFHDGYPWPPQDAGVYRLFRECFSCAAPLVRGRVVNLSPASALACFERGDLDDVLPPRSGAASS